MENLKIWNEVRQVPQEAQKAIQGVAAMFVYREYLVSLLGG